MKKSLAALAVCGSFPGIAVAEIAPPPERFAPPAAEFGAPPTYEYAPSPYQYALPPDSHAAVSPDSPPPAESYAGVLGPKPKLKGAEFSLSIGYARFFGDLRKYSLSTGATGSATKIAMNGLSGQVPVVLGIGFRASPVFSLGAIAQYGLVNRTSDCGPDYSCSDRDVRLGLEMRFHLLPELSTSPWVSAGFGYEWLSSEVSDNGSKGSNPGSVSQTSRTLRGFELINLECGAAFRVNEDFTLGPYIGFRVQQFEHETIRISEKPTIDGAIPSDQKTIHGWIAFGIRAAGIP